MNCTDIDFELAPSKIRTEECGFQNKDLKVGDKGIIQTPNYPENYPPDIQCIWWLKVRIKCYTILGNSPLFIKGQMCIMNRDPPRFFD